MWQSEIVAGGTWAVGDRTLTPLIRVTRGRAGRAKGGAMILRAEPVAVIERRGDVTRRVEIPAAGGYKPRLSLRQPLLWLLLPLVWLAARVVRAWKEG